jgi:hypothetical protein
MVSMSREERSQPEPEGLMPQPRQWGLFERPRDAKPGTKWIRLHPDLAFPKERAVRLFQNLLLEPFLGGKSEVERCLKPVKEA